MKLVNGYDLMDYAKRNGYILPAFNTINMEMTYAIAKGLNDARLPGYIQISTNNLRLSNPKIIAQVAQDAADRYDVPIALHLDHGKTFESVNDLKAVRLYADEQEGIQFESVVPKGSRICVTDAEAFSSLRDDLLRQFSNTATSAQSERVGEIVRLLMKQHRAVSMYDVETQIFVSRSTLFSDLKKVDVLLARYDLELMRSASKLFIDGTEINRRRAAWRTGSSLRSRNCSSLSVLRTVMHTIPNMRSLLQSLRRSVGNS